MARPSEQILAKARLRRTHARGETLRKLTDFGRPTSHRELAEALPNLEKSSVYRILKDFCHAGIVVRLDYGDGVWRYELTERPSNPTDPVTARFVCQRCGLIAAIDLAELSAAETRKAPGSIAAVVVHGVCVLCLAPRPADSEPATEPQ